MQTTNKPEILTVTVEGKEFMSFSNMIPHPHPHKPGEVFWMDESSGVWFEGKESQCSDRLLPTYQGRCKYVSRPLREVLKEADFVHDVMTNWRAGRFNKAKGTYES